MIDSFLLKYNISDKKTICFDVETESLNLYYARPWQVAFVIYQGYKLIEEHSYFIKWPDIQVSKGAAEKTKFDKKKIDEIGKDPKEIMEIFGKYLYDESYILTGSNILNYDVMIFYNTMKKLGLKHDYSFLSRCYDCNALFKSYKLGLKPNYDNFLAWQFSLNNWKQKGLKSNTQVCAKEFNLPYDENLLHEALYDAKLEAQIFFELIKKIDVK
jgi:DNA polymerase III alpha subunit (gram-positive type)